MIQVSTKAPGEAVTLSIDFTAALASGDSVASLVSVTSTTRVGADRVGVLNGSASRSENVILIPVHNGASGGVYNITATVTTAEGDTLAASAVMAVS